MDKVELHIVALTKSESQPGSFAVILEDVDQRRKIPIIIGSAEARAIAIVLEKMKPPRPQTHDLLKSVISAFDATVNEVIINKVENDKFHAILQIQKDGEYIKIDSRTSDALAIAVRYNCPVFTYEHILLTHGYTKDSLMQKTSKKGSLHSYGLEELEQLLEKVIQKEDYESATRIREAINRKKTERK